MQFATYKYIKTLSLWYLTTLLYFYSTHMGAQPKILLSTDSLPSYWLDYIFDVAKNVWFDWIDLAMGKNFDARNSKYVKKLVKKYELPIHIIQTSPSITPREIQQAISLAEAVDAKIIASNAPKYFDIKQYKLISDGVVDWKKQFPNIDFSIITPDSSSITLLPVFPKYRFSSIVEIIKKYKATVWLDTSYITQESWDTMMMKKLENMVPYISVVYASDKNSSWVSHLPLGEGILPINTLLKQLYKYNYNGIFSVKLTFSKKDLADIDRIEMYFQKSIDYIKRYFKEEEE